MDEEGVKNSDVKKQQQKKWPEEKYNMSPTL